ncbi:MAG: elongation factor G [Planctomycetia bacterium]|nr:elongation factor G [Planctomycetia bacterium]
MPEKHARDLSSVRNFGIVAHIDAGKTTLSERLLFYTGKEHQMGEVHHGTAKMDYLPEEQERGITITAAATTFHWRGHELHLIDTPGHVDFTAEVERSLRVLDGAVVVFDAVNGVEAQSETVWRQATRYHVPRCCFVNKMDRPGADFDRSVESIRVRLHALPAPITMPVGRGEDLSGVIDLVTRELLTFSAADQGRTVTRGPVPAELEAEVEVRRQDLVDLVVEHSEAAGEKFLAGEALTVDDLKAGLRQATLAAKLFPTLCGAAFKNVGVQTVLDAVVDYLPSPLEAGAIDGKDPAKPSRVEHREPDPDGPLCALAFKIVGDSHGDLTFTRVYSGTLTQGQGLWNPRLGKHERAMRLLRMHANEREAVERAVAGDIVALVGLKETATGDTLCDKKAPIVLESMHFPEPVMSMRIEPKTNADRDRLAEALARLSREDPTFRSHVSPDTGETLIEGMGELHLEVLIHRLVRDLGVAANVGKPRVAYRQTVAGVGEAAFTFERQIASKTHLATVTVRVASAPGTGGVGFKNEARPDRVPVGCVAAVERGVRGASGGAAGFAWPAIDVQATLLDGSTHELLPPSEIAFEAAASKAYEQAFEAATPVLLEPAMRIEVHTPNAYTGNILADLNRRRVLIESNEQVGDGRVLVGRAPLSAMFGYSTTVRSLSEGRAGYSMEPAGYEPVPPEVAKGLF